MNSIFHKINQGIHILCIKLVQEGENETRDFLLKFTVHVVNRC